MRSQPELVAALEASWESVTETALPEGCTTSRVKKALNRLANEGVLMSPIVGRYVLRGDKTNLEPRAHGAFAELDPDETNANEAEAAMFERIVGDGNQSVYAFYLPTYRAAAEARGEDRWPIKIGMTTNNVVARIDSFRTALPEIPTLALRMRVDNATAMERVIHGILALRGQWLEHAGGSEWFLTNPHEVESIYKFIGTQPTPTAGDSSIESESRVEMTERTG
jgi:hypothetical protein